MNVLVTRALMGVDEFGKYYDEEFNYDASDIEVFVEIEEHEKADVIMESRKCAMPVHHGTMPFSLRRNGGLRSISRSERKKRGDMIKRIPIAFGMRFDQ